MEGSGAPGVGGSGSASWYRSSDSADWRALRKSIQRKVLSVIWFCSWRRRSVSVPLPFNSDGLLPFGSDGLKGFWFCSWRRRFWGSWRGVPVLLPDVEGSGAPGVGVLVLLPDVEGSGAPGVGVLFYSWRRRSGSVPLPFNSDGLLPFSSNGLKGFWFDWRALRKLIRRNILNMLFYSWRRSSVLFCSSTV